VYLIPANLHNALKRIAPFESDWHRLAQGAGYRATDLAQTVGVSLRTLQRHFRAQYGMTVSDWLKSLRLRRASDRIYAGETIKQVAFDLGYKQLSHFSRDFKRAYGCAPTIRFRRGRRADVTY